MDEYQGLRALNVRPDTDMNFKKILKRGNSIIPKQMKKMFPKRSSRYSLEIKSTFKKKIKIEKNGTSPVDLCLYSLNYLPRHRDNECLQHIISYLKSLPSFMNIISKEKNLKLSENLIEQISVNLRHEFIPKNNLICRFGERGEKFYIILKGKVNFLVPKPYRCYLNFEEYIVYLMQLRKNNEFELLSNLLVQNRIFYPIEDDDFDSFLKNEIQEYYKIYRKTNKSLTKILQPHFNNKLNNKEEVIDNENAKKDYIFSARNISIENYENNENEKVDLKGKKYKRLLSINTYRKMEELVDKINHPRLMFDESQFLGENSPKNYLKANNVSNPNLDSKERKLVYIYKYEEMNSFENGQTFGFIALQSKNCKRAATAIASEDCDLGVLNKEEYIKFFEMLSNKEKKNLYELLKFYNLLSSVSEHKFIKRYYHMFEYIKYRKNNYIMEINKPINEILIFQSGLFEINIFMNIPELNELITKIKLIKGKLLGLSKKKIERDLDEKRENQDLIMRKNYISSSEYKSLYKRYNFTLSIISEHLLIGYPDTVDPVTHLSLFNCVCSSAEGDGYFLLNKHIKFINEDSIVIQDLNEFCLMKIDYNLNRLQQFKKEIISKSKKNGIPSTINLNEDNSTNVALNSYKKRAFSENNLGIDDTSESKKYCSERNQTLEKRSKNNNKNLISLKFNSRIIENALSRFNNKLNKNDEIGSNKDRSINQSSINSKSRINNSGIYLSRSSVIKKLKESILQKQKKIEFKKMQYFKHVEELDNNKKLKLNELNSKLRKKILVNIKLMKSRNNNDIFLNERKTENSNENENENDNENGSFDNHIKHSFGQNFYPINNKNNITNKTHKNAIIQTYLKNSIDSGNKKAFTPFKSKDNQLTLPSIKINKNNNLNSKINLQTESDSERFIVPPKPHLYISNNKSLEINKKQTYSRNNGFISYEDLSKNTQISPTLVKEKYIIFNLQKKNQTEEMKTINNHLPNKIRLLKPIKLRRNNLKNLDVLLNLDKNNNNNEDKKIDYINYVLPITSNRTHKKINLDFFIKDKYKELNALVKSLQKTTKEILDNNGI